jgi:hypothetical protein
MKLIYVRSAVPDLYVDRQADSKRSIKMHYVRQQSMLIKITVFRDITSCRLVYRHRRLEKGYSLHLQGLRIPVVY